MTHPDIKSSQAATMINANERGYASDRPQLGSFFPGKSELAAIMRNLDWSKTDLPPPVEWPAELRVCVKLLLSAKPPVAIFWGPDYILLYNDAYLSIIGEEKHPQFLGKRSPSCNEKEWEIFYPLFKRIYETGESFSSQDMFYDSNLEARLRITCTPIWDETSCHVAGVICSWPETIIKKIRDKKNIKPSASVTMQTNASFSVKNLLAHVGAPFDLTKHRRALINELNTMTRLHAIATRFVQEAEVSSLLLEIIDAAISITHADKGLFQLADEETGLLKCIASRGFGPTFLEHMETFPIRMETCATAFQRQERFIIENISEQSVLTGTDYIDPLLAEGMHAVQATPLKSSSGKILGILSTHYRNWCRPEPQDFQMMDLLARLSVDIIERGQWIRERANWVEKLREADRRKDDFLAMLSHELRNPLASISSSIFVLSKTQFGSDAAIRAQTTINRQVEQMTRLVDDLLDVTRITRNKIRLQIKSVDVNEIVNQTIKDQIILFDRACVRLKKELYPQPLVIFADPMRIAQAIGNLLQNAAKFSKTGGTTTVAVSLDEANQLVTITVVDDGLGIEPELLKNLFKPFMQADRTLHRSKGGLGLGLSLVKGLVELHGGKVSAESGGVGLGAKFIIQLPTIQAMKEAHTEAKESQVEVKKSRKVLIIEDNVDAAESLREVLQMLGHSVTIAFDGADGIQKARLFQPEIVLCDIGLPGLDGYQVARSFKEDPILCSAFLIALSGYAATEDVEKSYACGFDAHLAKPANLEKLIGILES